MKLRNILIVVKDIARARKYYHDLFGLDMLLDNDENMILTEGLVLQQEACWTESSWGQKVIRFYDLDGNLIEVGTPVYFNYVTPIEVSRK